MPSSIRERDQEEFLAGLLRRRPQDAQHYESRVPPRAPDGFRTESVGLGASDDRRRALETIVSEERPVAFIRDGRIDKDNVHVVGREAADLMSNLDAARTQIEPLLPRIGRIDVVNFPNGFPYVGTGWFIDTDIVVTNRHVAELIAAWDGRRYAFTPGVRNLPMSPTLRTRHEFDDRALPEDPYFPATEVLYIEPRSGLHDIAFIRVSSAASAAGPGFIELSDTDVGRDHEVCVVGYPARAGQDLIPDQALMRELYLDRYDVKRIAPGFMLSNEGADARHDCTTLGGNSGSVVLDPKTGAAVGLHFAGLYKQANYAVPASALRDYVTRRRWLTPPTIETGSNGAKPARPTDAAPQSTSTVVQDVVAGAVASVSIPLTITVDVRVSAALPDPRPQDAAGAPSVESAELAARAFWRDKPAGVLAVRVGFEPDGAGIGERPIVVASVDPRSMDAQAAAPSSIFGVPVRFEAASLQEQLDARRTTEATSSIAYDDAARDAAPYSFESVDDTMSVIAHVGPEYSWSTLKLFLEEAVGHLQSGIYEFRGPHIRDVLQRHLDKGGSLSLVMDNATFAKVQNPQVEIDARATFDDWEQRYGSRFERIVAPEGATGLIANSYHIKVTVRDDDAFWLSSGNWKLNSSQPEITSRDLDAATSVDLPGNREWHVVVKNKTLADRFRAHLKQDFGRATELNGGPLPRSMMEEFVVVSPEAEAIALERPAPRKILEPLTIGPRRVSVKYLLTPDKKGAVYSEAVLSLIRSAESSLLFQIPYIGMPPFPGADRGYIDDLIEALSKKLKSLPDARLILASGSRKFSDPRHAAWYFKSKGVDVDARVRMIDRHHTKGMVVDGQRVLIGSHNWSGDGVSLNRDASLIFDDREIAGYFGEAFRIDWDRASAVNPKQFKKPEMILLDRRDEAVMPGGQILPLSEVIEG